MVGESERDYRRDRKSERERNKEREKEKLKTKGRRGYERISRHRSRDRD